MARAQEQNLEHAAAFFDVFIRSLDRDPRAPRPRVLDFGCGTGQLVGMLRDRGYDAWGCDTWGTYSPRPLEADRLREIGQRPYRIPYEDESFDVVVSTMVFEHAQNKDECFEEIRRVLKPGGHAIHMFPGKWYLPTEPHIYVPLASWFWPRVPTWWLGLWALIGIRNEFQQGLPWREVRDRNVAYCRDGISYWSTGRYRASSNRVFGRCSFPMELFLSQPGGRFSRMAQRLPFKRLLGRLSRECRISVLVQQKVRASA